ncbi:peptide chain release factor N(5)-glutamine methyltransferase [Acetoanaerobium noterae]|uniref:peptide chain release factor N(5)-glutamine methyltransferase n=1 Tax=Acetoanaerobium noterae TaxID=745369 RepID=UPI0032216808
MKIKDIINYGVAMIKNTESPSLETQMMIAKVIEKDRLYIMLNLEEDIDESKVEIIKTMIDKRKNSYPLQYILGEREFWGMDFKVSEGVLIPRQDTEILIEETLKKLKDNKHKSNLKGFEIGVGSGIISITLLKEIETLTMIGVDINDKAIELTKANALKHEVSDRLCILNSNLFEKINKENQFDFIISNPPYIETKVIDSLQEDIKQHEPKLALDGGEDGLDFYRAIIEQSKSYISPYGFIAFEIGYNQAEAVKKIFVENGYPNVTIAKDLAGFDRVVIGMII